MFVYFDHVADSVIARRDSTVNQSNRCARARDMNRAENGAVPSMCGTEHRREIDGIHGGSYNTNERFYSVGRSALVFIKLSFLSVGPLAVSNALE